jgi:hypothetical protein
MVKPNLKETYGTQEGGGGHTCYRNGKGFLKKAV